MTFTINHYYFYKQHQPVGFCNTYHDFYEIRTTFLNTVYVNFTLQRANQLCGNVRWHLWQVTVTHTWQYTVWPITVSNYLWCFTSTCHSQISGSLLFCIIYLASGLQAGWPGLDPQQCKIFLFTTIFRLTLGPTQPPIQWVLGAHSPGVKWLGSEVDHFYLVLRSRWSYTSTPTPPYVFMAGTKLPFIYLPSF
jgi:hypothetical protein